MAQKKIQKKEETIRKHLFEFVEKGVRKFLDIFWHLAPGMDDWQCLEDDGQGHRAISEIGRKTNRAQLEIAKEKHFI